MFITQQLKTIFELIEGFGLSKQLQQTLAERYLNLEATLLRAKVLRDFSHGKVQYIVQSAIHTEQAEVACLFAPFILANLNHPVIYTSPATPTVLNILNRYYQADQKHNLKIDDVLEALKLYLDLTEAHFSDVDFLYDSLIKALCRTDVSQIFLLTALDINRQKIAELEQFFKVKIEYVQIHAQDKILDSHQWDMHQVFFKNKDKSYAALCEQFAVLNAQLLFRHGSYNLKQATQLVEDMFYAEHIYEKLSVYAEYMQTCLQQHCSRAKMAF